MQAWDHIPDEVFKSPSNLRLCPRQAGDLQSLSQVTEYEDCSFCAYWMWSTPAMLVCSRLVIAEGSFPGFAVHKAAPHILVSASHKQVIWWGGQEVDWKDVIFHAPRPPANEASSQVLKAQVQITIFCSWATWAICQDYVTFRLWKDQCRHASSTSFMKISHFCWLIEATPKSFSEQMCYLSSGCPAFLTSKTKAVLSAPPAATTEKRHWDPLSCLQDLSRRNLDGNEAEIGQVTIASYKAACW